ncbi:MAG TPA: ABC transporter permease, partial [Bacillota bacterium]|nr:ABC transporter permease [Bacillota bacterium]
FVLYGRSLLSSGLVWLYCLNTLAFTIVSASIGFLVGSSVKSVGAQAGAVNVIANAMSFIGGVFVPQSILSKQVLDVGRFLPAYWYVKANDAISRLSRPTTSALRPIYGDVLIQLAFAAAIFATTLLLTKERQAE